MATSSVSSSATASYNATGLASNIDWSSIIDNMVKLQQAPLDTLRSKQAAIRTQISTIGDVASKLGALDTASRALATGGLLSVQVDSSSSGFTATTGPGATSGSYAVQVTGLATVAKARSDGFASRYAEVRSGSLALTVMGKPYTVALKPGGSLADAAAAINASGAPVVATLLDNGTNTYLSLTNRDTGYPVDLTDQDALKVVETSDAGTAPPLALQLTQTPTNAGFTLDGLPYTRTSNVVTDALPGVTLTLRAKTAAPEDLLLDNDPSGTASRLQSFVDAYNNVLGLVQKQLNVSEGTDRTTSLAGDTNVRSLQQRLQSILVTKVGGGTVRSLADLGVKTGRDGTLTVVTDTLTAAMTRDPGAVDALFSTASSGLADQVKGVVKLYTDTTTGLLTQRTSSLNRTISDLDDSATKLQLRLDTMRKTLVAQFTAMENVISGLKATGQYLDQQSAAATKGSNS